MKFLALAATLVFVSGAGAAGAIAADPEALAKANGCLNCHAAATKKIGPAFMETAAKYKGKADAEKSILATLADEAKHPAAKKPEDLKAILQWILAM